MFANLLQFLEHYLPFTIIYRNNPITVSLRAIIGCPITRGDARVFPRGKSNDYPKINQSIHSIGIFQNRSPHSTVSIWGPTIARIYGVHSAQRMARGRQATVGSHYWDTLFL